MLHLCILIGLGHMSAIYAILAGAIFFGLFVALTFLYELIAKRIFKQRALSPAITSSARTVGSAVVLLLIVGILSLIAVDKAQRPANAPLIVSFTLPASRYSH